MRIDYHRKFQKNYLKRIKNKKNLEKIFKERTALFAKDPNNSFLQDHALTGRLKGLRSFSVTGDIRVIYRPIGKDCVLFLDIGSHNQVY